MSRASIRDLTTFIFYGGHPNQNPNWIALARSTTNFPPFFVLAGQPLAQPVDATITTKSKPSIREAFIIIHLKALSRFVDPSNRRQSILRYHAFRLVSPGSIRPPALFSKSKLPPPP
jgi:hypothetical protein